eukprot:3671869-Pyramimonas_sp.AAC.1
MAVPCVASVRLVDSLHDYALVAATNVNTGDQAGGPVAILWSDTVKELKIRLQASMSPATRSAIRIVDVDGAPVQDVPWRQNAGLSDSPNRLAPGRALNNVRAPLVCHISAAG